MVKGKMVVVRGMMPALVMVMLLFSMTTVASADDGSIKGVRWLLGHNATTPGYEMDQVPVDPITNPPSNSLVKNVVITGASVIWTASKPADVDLSFPPANWIVHLGGQKEVTPVNVFLGVWNPDSKVFTPVAEPYYLDERNSGVTEFEVPVGTLTMKNGEYLALKLEAVNKSFRIRVLGNSWIEYPMPHQYPNPELPSGILLGVSLVGLIGYVRFRGLSQRTDS